MDFGMGFIVGVIGDMRGRVSRVGEAIEEAGRLQRELESRFNALETELCILSAKPKKEEGAAGGDV